MLNWFPKPKTRKELENDYLNGSKSLADLEYRMRLIDQGKVGNRGRGY